jgi:hypothetical protein
MCTLQGPKFRYSRGPHTRRAVISLSLVLVTAGVIVIGSRVFRHLAAKSGGTVRLTALINGSHRIPGRLSFQYRARRLLGQSTSMVDQECIDYTDPAGPRKRIIKIERTEHSLLLITPVANVPRENRRNIDDG